MKLQLMLIAFCYTVINFELSTTFLGKISKVMERKAIFIIICGDALLSEPCSNT